MTAAVVVIVVAVAAGVVGVWMTLALSLWSFVVLPAALVFGVVALRLQVRAAERADAQPTPAPTRRGRHRR